ncbi:antibiotic biosynthesis monooxygenase [Pseudomonas sp. CDFA 602]|uniref:putative quinol monooxygenase n=1 Tax=Pseudomonas californiensis TaxID=2829823 RepID=UPI001E336692|nr:putative quinol monooxygenase [Pseudomonas californiensis]MCD5997116.1 antibiotic biosynthesis monooxygenase [Pseudomonas californiensis]MCD6002718.1 antibiotic biosynthesis monooxygenase [Pseudomonas californiensis]
MNNLHGFILHAQTRPEKSAEFEALFSDYVAASRSEPGCIEYHMLRDQQDPTLFIFFEIWASKAHLDVHSNLPHMTQFFENRMEYLTRDFDIRRIDMVSPPSAGAAPAAPSL